MSRFSSSNYTSTTSHRELPFQTTKKIEFLENRNGIKRLDLHTNTLGKWDNLIARTEPSLPSSPKSMISPRNKEFQQANRTIFPEHNSEIEKPSTKKYDLPFREKSPAYPGRITNLYEKAEIEAQSAKPTSKRLHTATSRAESTQGSFRANSPQDTIKKVHPRKVNDYYSSITTLPASTVREKEVESIQDAQTPKFRSSNAIKQYQLRSSISSLPASEASLKIDKTTAEAKNKDSIGTLLARNISTSYLTQEIVWNFYYRSNGVNIMMCKLLYS